MLNCSRGIEKILHRIGEAGAFSRHDVINAVGVFNHWRLMDRQIAFGITQRTLKKLVVGASNRLGLRTRADWLPPAGKLSAGKGTRRG